MADAHKNFAFSTVATAPSPATTGVSLVVAAGEGANFPTPPFNAVVWPTAAQPSKTNAEVLRVTGISTDTLTIARTQEGSSARTVVIGDQIAAMVTNKTLTDGEGNRKPSDDMRVRASFSTVLVQDLEIAAGKVYELEVGGILEIR